MHHKYTDEQRDFIREIAPGQYNQDIADMFNEKFGAQVTASQIKSYKANHMIRSGVKSRRTVPQGLFNCEQIEFIKKHVAGLHNQELAELINNEFNLSITVRQLKTWKKNHGLSSGLKGTEGKAPPNKGTRGLYNVGGNKTSFKSGQRPVNYKPVGYERIDRDGYVLVKVRDDGPWHKRWRHKHRILWESANGPIPKGHVLIFLDQNKQNIELDNLILIPQSKLPTLNKKGLLYHDAELTKTGIIIADLYQKIGERKRQSSKQ
ncbi:HNH endonuclease [Xylanibacillus composti]|uniref:HNH nuclease domain-containing protein n=1 Tax=Xylanibacillus composti TaxID=1572762 RepID=A0A8J4M0U2_9BACL|nr:HNH endonuclease signature motif containing protein [Xylanibacillus composti]MDT9723797.1 HNH endonuclease [Xylanibacillus composti]GIQ67430.1 hypothetical protein XYCOK13_02540 [Xylanibacillus composti]